MPLIPLDIPAGVYRNGTDLQSSGRWRDSNLVRWRNNAMGPIGGWRARFTPLADVCRGMLAWTDNSQDKWVAAGTKQSLYIMSASGTAYDITPTGGLALGFNDATVNIGYSGGFYGFEEYGVQRQDNQTITAATTWSFDEWGQNLIACCSTDGRLLEWDTLVANKAAVIANSPIDNRSVVVTAERFVFALGADGNPHKIRWCDRENNTDWTPTATNEAGDIELQTSGAIQAAVRVQGQTLILTETDAHIATYIGPPFVYGFERVGTSCGAISQKAVTTTDAGAFWMGRSSFFVYAGGNAQAIPSDVSDYVFSDINTGQRSKVYAVTNAKFSEVWWFYPSADSTENDRYVVYNFVENTWAIGSLSRSAAVDSGSFNLPMWVSPLDNQIYEHEIGWYHDGQSPFAESGPISLGAGDNVMQVVGMIPDEQTQGQVNATFKTRFYPNDIERLYGPYSMANPTSIRFTGRQVRMRVEGIQSEDWRVGVNRLEVFVGGKR